MLIPDPPAWFAMRLVAATLAALLLLAAPPAAAQAPDRSSCLAFAPPCGYITPLMDLEFPEKPKCGAGAGGPSRCITIPEEGRSVSFAGKVRWYWKLSEDLTYPPDTQQPIVVSFSGTATNPKFLGLKVEPPQFTIQPSDLFDPRHMPTEGSGLATAVYYSYEQAVNVTFTRAGAPTAAELDRLAARDGVLSVYLKAQSNANGAYFREAFGIEEFRFNGTGLLATPETRGAPAPGWAVPLMALAAAVLLTRRRAR
jgi:hypothetical protein